MRLEEGKLILTEAELACVKRANLNASPTVAGMFLLNYLKSGGLAEDLEHEEHDVSVRFYAECIQAYRRKSYEVM